MQTDKDWHKQFDVLTFNKLESSNEEAKMFLDYNIVESNSIIWVEHQTSGKGRMSRKWESTPGNLTFSIILKKHHFNIESISALPFITSLAIGQAIESSFSQKKFDISLKWPNDVLINNKKVAGILIESKILPSQKIDWIIIGIGLNILASPSQTSYPSTSLFTEGLAIANSQMLDNLMQKFTNVMQSHQKLGFPQIRKKWLEKAAFKNQKIQISMQNKVLTGEFSGIDKDGNLKLQLSENETKTIKFGDIFF